MALKVVWNCNSFIKLYCIRVVNFKMFDLQVFIGHILTRDRITPILNKMQHELLQSSDTNVMNTDYAFGVSFLHRFTIIYHV